MVAVGIAATGSISSFQTQFNPLSGSIPKIIRLATFKSILDDITNSLAVGLIDSQAIANALSRKINATSKAAVAGDNKAAKNILSSFLNEVSAQSGKHIKGIAPQVLLEDADSLLRQLP